jgi:hypothetical protein
MMKQELARKRWTAQQAPGYVSGWSNVAISKGGANIGRMILRKQERT